MGAVLKRHLLQQQQGLVIWAKALDVRSTFCRAISRWSLNRPAIVLQTSSLKIGACGYAGALCFTSSQHQLKLYPWACRRLDWASFQHTLHSFNTAYVSIAVSASEERRLGDDVQTVVKLCTDRNITQDTGGAGIYVLSVW